DQEPAGAYTVEILGAGAALTFIDIKVEDAAGNPISGASGTVTLSDGSAVTVMTDVKGEVHLTDVPVGQYTLKLDDEGSAGTGGAGTGGTGANGTGGTGTGGAGAGGTGGKGTGGTGTGGTGTGGTGTGGTGTGGTGGKGTGGTGTGGTGTGGTGTGGTGGKG